MLHRSTAAPVWAPARWLHQRRGALAGSTSNLLRYVMIAALLTAIGCAYLWQVNSLSDVYDKTVALQAEARELEKQNVTLAEQLAQWSSPAYVEKRSTEEGYVVASPHAILEPVVVASSSAAANASR
jgi:cell division protein FtsB